MPFQVTCPCGFTSAPFPRLAQGGKLGDNHAINQAALGDPSPHDYCINQVPE